VDGEGQDVGPEAGAILAEAPVFLAEVAFGGGAAEVGLEGGGGGIAGVAKEGGGAGEDFRRGVAEEPGGAGIPGEDCALDGEEAEGEVLVRGRRLRGGATAGGVRQGVEEDEVAIREDAVLGG